MGRLLWPPSICRQHSVRSNAAAPRFSLIGASPDRCSFHQRGGSDIALFGRRNSVDGPSAPNWAAAARRDGRAGAEPRMNKNKKQQPQQRNRLMERSVLRLKALTRRTQPHAGDFDVEPEIRHMVWGTYLYPLLIEFEYPLWLLLVMGKNLFSPLFRIGCCC